MLRRKDGRLLLNIAGRPWHGRKTGRRGPRIARAKSGADLGARAHRSALCGLLRRENGRHALQVHAPLYRDLLTILQREALLAACVRALEISTFETIENGRGKQKVVMRKGAESFRRKFLSALARQQNWNAGDALDFQSDLKMYEDLLARAASSRRPRKPYEAANHPFVDRCAFMLDSDFLEKARLAASRALTSVEEIAAKLAFEA
jgi:hypothetical protein